MLGIRDTFSRCNEDIRDFYVFKNELRSVATRRVQELGYGAGADRDGQSTHSERRLRSHPTGSLCVAPWFLRVWPGRSTYLVQRGDFGIDPGGTRTMWRVGGRDRGHSSYNVKCHMHLFNEVSRIFLRK
eukprot:995986_1